MATRNIDGKLLRTMPMLSLDNLFYLYEKEKDIKIIKSTLECGTLRDEAGKFYNDSSYLESLLYLNKSLCVGIVGTDEYNMTIIGRSLICVFIDADVAALKNVEYLKIGKYPPDTKHHVDNVIKKSTRSLANAVKGDASELLNTPLYNFFYERPSNSPKIKVLSPLIITEGYFTTTKNIKMGDIIAIEQPFFGASFGDSANMNCANCMKFSTFTLIPCDGCTTSMFCSEECKKEATNGYHRYECDVIDRILLVFNDFYKVIMVFRILFKALAICGGSVAEMKRVFTLNKKETILEFKYESHEFLSDPKEQLYASFAFNCNLLPWSLTRKKEETALYFKFLKLFPKLKSIWQNREESAFILLYLTIHARYAFSTESENSSQPEQWVGSAYPLRSFMQSSCLPNVVGYIYDRCSVVYRAQENLKAGSIITIQHASLMAEDWFYKRLYHFYECFDFICNCEACNKNFHPLISRKEFYKMKILAQRFKKGLDFTRPIIDDITNLDEYYDELQQVWEKEPNPAMVLKWFGIAIYNLSLRESLKISPYITKFDEIMDQTE